MNQNQQPQPWWKDNRLVWALAALVLIWLLTITILFLFPLPTILSLFHWQSWDWRWLVLLGLIFLSAGVLYLTLRRAWYRVWAWVWARRGFQGKTLWDWMKLLIVPLVIGLAVGLAGWWLSEVSTRTQQEIENRRAQAQQQIEQERAQEAALQTYLDRITELLKDESLGGSSLKVQNQLLARARTITILQNLEGQRRKEVMLFLYESGLILKDTKLITFDLASLPQRKGILQDARLMSIDLSGLGLTKINLHGANLSNANLSGANLAEGDLSNALLIGVNLINAHLISADLCGAFLTNADLGNADLKDALLLNTSLQGADLTAASLIGANLSDANLPKNKDLSPCGNLAITDPPRITDLRDAKVTNEQLAQAGDLVGAIMPNGTKMTQECWEVFRRGNFQCTSP